VRSAMDKIIIKNMKFYAYHGVLPSERESGQFFHIDLEMYTDLAEAGESDELKDTVDYSEVFNLIKNINENNKFKLIEKLAETIINTLLAKYSQLDKVKISVKKPNAPIKGEFDWVGVELVRGR
jgi:dihydroneopterin aldolase